MLYKFRLNLYKSVEHGNENVKHSLHEVGSQIVQVRQSKLFDSNFAI